MRPRIKFDDYEMKQIAKDTGLSKLELMGVIAAMNRFTHSIAVVERWNHDEMMGRHIDV